MLKIESSLPYKSIVQIFNEPDIKKQLKTQIRYERYRISETPEHFAYLLGPDVRFMSHPGVTYNITQEFISVQNKISSTENLTSDDASALLTAALIHDWGELRIEDLGYGDITFEEHQLTHEQTEGSVFEKLTEKIEDKDDRFFFREIYQHVVQDRSSRLGRMFNAIERIGYLRTGLRAYKGLIGMRIDNWAGLAGNVLSNQIISLLDYASEFPYVSSVLLDNAQLITSAFNEISKMEIPLDNRGVLSFDIEKFQKNFQTWQQSPLST